MKPVLSSRPSTSGGCKPRCGRGRGGGAQNGGKEREEGEEAGRRIEGRREKRELQSEGIWRARGHGD